MLIKYFEKSAARFSNRSAIHDGKQNWTYQELDNYANQIAHRVANLGNTPGNNPRVQQNVALLFGRGSRMVAAQLGVLKADKTYVPMEANYPGNRLLYMLEDSRSWLLLTDGENVGLAHRLVEKAGTRIVVLDIDSIERRPSIPPLRRVPSGKNNAYILYTSGSTGKPRGVLQTHENVLHHITNWTTAFSISPDDRLTLFSSYSHDASVMDIFGALLNGATLFPYRMQDNPGAVSQWLIERQITVYHSVPTLFRHFINSLSGDESFQKLRLIILGGEAVTGHDIKMFQTHFPNLRLANLYGQTESSFNWVQMIHGTVNVTGYSIGTAAEGIEMLLVTEEGEILEEIGEGEIVIAGRHLVPGYLNAPEDTAWAFTDDPQMGGIYWTGDLGRLRPGGYIEFLGRKDHQVKIRGFRVESGEVETAMLSYPGIEYAVVIKREDNKNNEYLHACYKAPETISSSILRQYLLSRLPDYMIPTYFTRVDTIPLLPNGKVDRRALPVPAPEQEDHAAVPRDYLQEEIASVWAEVLGVPLQAIGIDSNFFALGGHSLRAAETILKINRRLNLNIPLEELFKTPTINGLSAYIKKNKTTAGIQKMMTPVETRSYYALSSAQKRLYFIQQLSAGSTGYNTSRVLLLEGHLEKETIENAFRALIKRHEILRTAIIRVEDQPVQKIYPDVFFSVRYFTPGDLPMGTDDHPRVKEIISEFVRPFDLKSPPPLRVGLIRLAPDRHLLIVDIHHICADGISMSILIGDFLETMRGRQLPPLKFRYTDFCQWQDRFSHRREQEQQEAFWANLFQGEIPVLNLPTDYPRPVIRTFEGDRFYFSLARSTAEALKELALKEEMTLYMLLLTLYTIFLSKLGTQEDIIVGTPTSGRRVHGLENTVGMFVNTLALRYYPVGEKPSADLMREIKETTLRAFENQDYPFEKLVKLVSAKEELSRNPLFDVMFVYQDMDVPLLQVPGLTIKMHSYQPITAKFDLILMGSPNHQTGGVDFTFEYDVKLFKETSIARYRDYFANVTTQVLHNPSLLLQDIAIITDDEKTQVLETFNNTAEDFSTDKIIPLRFEEQVERNPAAVAITWQEHFLTYRELNRKVNRLAYRLRVVGIDRGHIVGVMAERTESMFVGALAVMKAGGTYLPLDPDYPLERITYMLANSNAALVLTREHRQKNIAYNSMTMEEEPGACLPEHNPPCNNDPIDPVYVIYTSGSTGRPKGVMVQHDTFLNAAFAWQKAYHLDEEDFCLLQIASFSFDVSAGDIARTFINNGRMVICPEDERTDPVLLYRIIIKHRIDLFESTPGLIIPLMNYVYQHRLDTGYLKILIMGSDVCKVEDFRNLVIRFGDRMRVINSYGATEATVTSSLYEEKLENIPSKGNLPIGKPMSNMKYYILDKRGNIQPPGIPGELYLGGRCVSRGYINNPDLTRERFAADPFMPGAAVYKTGDLAKWLEDGNVEFLGRFDNQVKIRGFRIEIEEIAGQLLKFPGIKECVVVARQDDRKDKYLCAYFTGTGELTVSGLRMHLAKILPHYMIPSYFVRLEKMPLSGNAKIDRKALPPPNLSALRSEVSYKEPRTREERLLASAYEEVLGRRPVGIDDNFFMIGGDSIRCIQLVSRIDALGFKIGVKDVFMKPTIAELVPMLSKVVPVDTGKPEPGPLPLTPIQVEFFLNPVETHHYNHTVLLHAKEYLGEEMVRGIFTHIQSHHHALCIVFRRQEGKIIPFLEGNPGDMPISLQEFDLRGKKDTTELLEKLCSQIQASIDLEKGPLMKLGLFHCHDGDRLLVTIHHLVIDGVSWRILLEDIGTLYRRYKSAGKLALPPKTASFKSWAEKLAQIADSDSILAEKPYWANIEANYKNIPGITPDLPGENLARDTALYSCHLSPSDTDLLLSKVNYAYNTEINDILLTALALALDATFGITDVLLALEGHGREETGTPIDITRTVGWFTAIYPVSIKVSRPHSPVRQLKEVKEYLRRVPNRGMGYGILRYLTREENKQDISFRLEPQISFNYLGQFDREIENLPFTIAREHYGPTRGLNRPRKYRLDVSGMITGKRLSISLLYPGKMFHRQTIVALADNYIASLKELIGLCASRSEAEPTPWDFTYKELSIDMVEQLSRVYAPQDIYPLSPMQEGMLFRCLYDRQSHAYFQQVNYVIGGEPDISIVESSFRELFNRHPVLRSVFLFKTVDRPLQVAANKIRVQFGYTDIRHLETPQARTAYLDAFKKEDRRRSFDFEQDDGTGDGNTALMRLAVHRVEDARYVFTWSYHHILMDGWCLGILTAEFMEFYESLRLGRQAHLPAAIPYNTYIKWLGKLGTDRSKQYWSHYLADYRQAVSLPKETGMPGGNETNNHRRFDLPIPAEKRERLAAAAARHMVTLNTVLQTLWGILLSRYNHTGDVVFGVVVSGRPPEIEKVETIVGLFINTVPLRIRISPTTSLLESWKQVQENVLAGQPYHYHPLKDIQNLHPLKQDLFDHIMVFEDYPLHEELIKVSGAHLFRVEEVDSFELTEYDFYLEITPGDLLNIHFQYNAGLYEPQMVERLAGHLGYLVDQAAENPAIPVEELSIITSAEKEHILYRFNDTTASVPLGGKVLSPFPLLFRQQAARTPDAVAGKCEDSYMTYHQLDMGSLLMARRLREKGVTTDSIVGIIAHRTLRFLGAILAVWQAGGAYLPIDPDYPPGRIDYMLSDSSAGVFLVEPVSRNQNPPKIKKSGEPFAILELGDISPLDGSVDRPRQEWEDADLSDLAYVIYTSGSTGRPKGAMIEHAGMMNHLFSFITNLGLDNRSVIAQNASQCFDVSVWQFTAALLLGGQTVVYPQTCVLDAVRFARSLECDGVTVLEVVPSYLHPLLEEMVRQHLPMAQMEYLVVTGEEVTPGALAKWFSAYPHIPVANVYGPAEASDDITLHRLNGTPMQKRVPIGKPLANLNVYIVDNHMRLCPLGVKGEIVVSGLGVGRGYINNITGTRESFGYDPYKGNGKLPLYRTGDLGRLLTDGTIEFLGREDHQVKIRGQRIELGEIEARLCEIPGIREAVVVTRERRQGMKDLCGYYSTDAGNTFTAHEVRQWLAKKLPDHMVPTQLVPMERFPLTPNGKIDRRKLPEPGESLPTGEKGPNRPRTPMEALLADIYKTVLAKTELDIHDNFFMIGGDSIKAIQVSARLNQAGYKASVRDIFTYPTVARLAPELKRAGRVIDQSEVSGIVPLTPVQEAFFTNFAAAPAAYVMSLMLKTKGILDETVMTRIFARLQAHHDALRMTFRKEGETVIQESKPNEGFPLGLKIFNPGEAANRQAGNAWAAGIKEIRAGINLEKGPLMGVGLFHTPGGDRLYIAVHHLVIDGISWRILIEDLENLYRQYHEQEPGNNNASMPLPLKTDSYKTWAEKLSEYADSEILLAEKAYWAAVESTPVTPIKPDFDHTDFHSNADRLSFHLSPAETALLLTDVHRAYGTEINEILLAALGMAVTRTFRIGKVLVALEGHGREDIIRPLDISRTIGWFTSEYPVILDMAYQEQLDRQVREIKEMVRRIPNRGIGYGILKYLTKEENKTDLPFNLEPQIGFNYLGQFDDAGDGTHFSLDGDFLAMADSHVNPGQREYPLTLIGHIQDERLTFTISYSRNQYKPHTIHSLLEHYKNSLIEVISICTARQERELTPADLTYNKLSISQLDELEELFRQ